MSILEKLGLAPKKRQEAPVIGEKKKQQEEASSLRKNIYIRVLILFGFLVLLAFSVPQADFTETVNHTVGEPWRNDDLTAPFTFPIQKDQETIEQERQAIKESTLPIYHKEPGVQSSINERIDSLFQQLDPVLNSFRQWQMAKADSASSMQADSLDFVNRRNNLDFNLSNAALNALLTNYKRTEIQDEIIETKSAPTSRFVGPYMAKKLSDVAGELLDQGIINTDKEQLLHQKVIVRNLQKRTETTVDLANLLGLEEARKRARNQLSKYFDSDLQKPAAELSDLIIQPNIMFNQQETKAHIEEAMGGISATKGAVAQGQVIIRRGDIVTQKKLNMLESLAEARSQNATELEQWLRYGGDILAVIAIATIFFFYLHLYRRYIFTDNAMLLLVVIALSLICVSSTIVYGLENISAYIVPVAIAPIILTIIFDSRVGLLATITLALLTGLINGGIFEYTVATTVACSLGLFSVRDIKKRSQFFFTTPGIVFISYAVVILAFSMTSLDSWRSLGSDLFFVFFNGIFILFTYPLILLFEKSFKVTTDFSLLELGDTNLPLLKQLMTKAPGTFHHSLQVSNLAEAAAGSIGANSLLCRVGGLYHDIGKMENPGYFTENQSEFNEHDKLKPRMSALVIKAHVSNGVKLAREHKLPEVVINFIKTHHGTSLIKYFWEEAQKNEDNGKKEIREEDFRYDGPRPHSKETGILMLADCVEASSRAMKDPNYQKLESLIDKMIEARVSEGQLSKTPLTFQDLTAIKETFLNILVGIYHSRVEYPDDEQDQQQADPKKPKLELKEDKSQEVSKLKAEKESGDGKAPSPPMDDYYNS